MSTVNKKLASVSLNQLRALTTSDNGLVMYRQKVFQCCLIGNVLSINEQTTKTSYVLADYTSEPMEIAMWKNSNEERRMARMPVPIMEQTYVKVYGQPRKDENNQVMFVAYNIQPLENINELTIHLLEVASHAKDLRKLKNKLLCSNQTSGDDFGSNIHNAPNSAFQKNVPLVAGFNQIQSLVMNVVKQNTSDIGISLDEIYGSIRSAPQETIKEAIDFLLNEGHIYEALDEVHFKSSE